MNVVLNGQHRSVADANNVAELVAELQLVPTTLLVEHNGLALHRTEWNSRMLRDGDRIELVRVVAGG
jgi:thiamine biosynthesis protein ThiS